GARLADDAAVPPVQESDDRSPHAAVVGVDLPLIDEPSIPFNLVARLDVLGIESVERDIDSFIGEKSFLLGDYLGERPRDEGILYPQLHHLHQNRSTRRMLVCVV